MVDPADVDDKEDGATNFFLYQGDGGFLLLREDWHREHDIPGLGLTWYTNRDAAWFATLDEVGQCRRVNGDPMMPEDRVRTLVEVAHDALIYKVLTE